MSNVTYVKGDELTALANSLKSKGESINNEYKDIEIVEVSKLLLYETELIKMLVENCSNWYTTSPTRQYELFFTNYTK